MVFTIQKERADANTESPPRTHPGTNICEVQTPSRTVFKRKHNELFIQRVFQYSQVAEQDELHYHALGLNESSTEDDKKKSYHSLALQF